MYTGGKGRGRTITFKAQIAGEVAEAPLATALLPSCNGAQPALSAAAQPPSASQPEGKGVSPALPGTSGKGGLAALGGGTAEGAPPAPVSKGSKRQMDASEKAAEGKAQLEGVAKLANELQPTGSTLSTMQVHTKVSAVLGHNDDASGIRIPKHLGLLLYLLECIWLCQASFGCIEYGAVPRFCVTSHWFRRC